MSRQGRAWAWTLALIGASALVLALLPERAPPATPPPLLASPDAALAVTLRPRKGPALRLERRGERFFLSAPLSTPADPARVEGLLVALAALGPGEPIDASAGGLARFGLDAPEWTLEIETPHGRRRVEIGVTSPFDGRRYLRVDGRDLRLVSDGLGARLDPRPTFWREKRLVPDPPESIDALTLVLPDLRLAIRREGSGEAEVWRRVDAEGGTGPEVSRAAARALVRLITEVRAVAFELPGPAQGGATGTLRVGLRDRTLTLTLAGLDEDASGGILAGGSELSRWVRLRRGALATLRERARSVLGREP